MVISPKPLPMAAVEALRKAGFRTDINYMQVPRCDTCQHWKRYWKVDTGSCLRLINPEGPLWARGLASVGTQEVQTREDFGCVEWAAGKLETQ